MVTKKQTYCFVTYIRLDGGTASLVKKKTDEAAATSIEEWTTYTNMKASFANAGEVVYASAQGFKLFTPTEVRNYLALYILQGLSPSPQVKQKFQPQSIGPVNGMTWW